MYTRSRILPCSTTEKRSLLYGWPPGTGCPLISTVTGIDKILIVTEPTVSVLHDLKRVVAVTRPYFRRIFVAINRSDLDDSLAHSIGERYMREKIPVPAEIPFDPSVIEAVRNCGPVIRPDISQETQAIQTLATKIDQERFGCGDLNG